MPNSAPSASPANPLEQLGVAPAAARILRYFALRPEARPHVRHLQRLLGLGGASTQRELERLMALGVLERAEDGRLVRYGVVPGSKVWTALRDFVGSTSDPADLVRDALRDVSGVQAAFVFGSTAAGKSSVESDIDVFVLEDATIDRRALLGQLAETGLLVGREVNTVRYTPQALAERLGNPEHPASHFVREVLAGPKRWVAGVVDAIQPLATAAGVQMDVVAATP